MAEHAEKEKKPIYKKWWFWAIIVVLVIGIAGAGSSSNNSTPTSSPSTPERDNSSQQQDENRVVNVGGEISTSDTKITFVSANDYTDYESYSAPEDGNKVIRAEFTFENISNSDIYLSNIDCYADGEKCDEYYYASDYKSPTLESLSSGKRVQAVVYYEVPTNAQSIILEYETNVWTSDKIEFKIK